MASRVGRRAEMNLPLQAGALVRHVPNSSARLRVGRLTWTGQVQPSNETRTYELRIDVKQHGTPAVWVLNDALKPNDIGLMPHVYNDGSLCLSRRDDWSPDLLLVQTFLPWACEWLTYYELWKATGLWYGDGLHRLDAASQAKILHPYG